MFLLNVADLLLYYKQLIYNHLQFLQFCEDFANFVYWYANTGSCNKPNLRVVLKTDSEVLDEVMVVGYGTVKKSELTGAISSVKADEIVKIQLST